MAATHTYRTGNQSTTRSDSEEEYRLDANDPDVEGAKRKMNRDNAEVTRAPQFTVMKGRNDVDGTATDANDARTEDGDDPDPEAARETMLKANADAGRTFRIRK